MRRLLQDRRGGIAIGGAAGGLFACITAAVVVDGAGIALHARRVQAAADLAALAAARDLPRAAIAAEATARSNVDLIDSVVTVTGAYQARADLPPDQRFRPAAAGEANAAQVTVTSAARLWFGGLLGRGAITLRRTGRAAVEGARPMAMLSIGSRLAALDEGVANQLLSALTGSSVSLKVMDYEGLARTQVDLLTFTDLLASELDVEVGDYDALLMKEVRTGRLLRLVEQVSEGSDAALSTLAQAADQRRLRVGDLIGLETSAPDALGGALSAKVSALDLVTAALEVSDGERQVRLDLPVKAGLAEVDAWLAIGERPNQSPWLAVDDDGDIIVRTAQARLFLRAKTSAQLAQLGRLTLPLLVELASAEARLSDIRCQPARAVDVRARSGLARLRLADVDLSRLDDFKREIPASSPVLLEVAGLVRVTGTAELDLSSSADTKLSFTDRDIAERRSKTVKSSGFVVSPLAALFETLDIRVHALGLPIGLGGLGTLAAGVIRPLAGVLDQVIDGALARLGLSLGEADVTVLHAVCPDRTGAPVLVG